MHKQIAFCMLVIACYAQNVFAASATIDISKDPTQNVFSGLIEDLGAALSYKALSPAEPLGITGFDIGFEITGTKMENNSLNIYTGGDAPSTLYVPKVHLHKGLPFGIDVGAFYSTIPSSNIEVIGGEVKYALMEGGVILPAVSVRGTFSKLSGVDDLEFSTTGLELSVSKGFAMVTPYAGIGKVRITGDSSLVSLTEAKFTESKLFLGVNFNFGLLNFAAETETTGDNSTTSAKIGIRF